MIKLYQKTNIKQMKINFDNLFKEDPLLSLDQRIINFALPNQDLLHKNNLNTSVQTQDATPITHRNPSINEQQSVRRVLEFKLALALQQEVQAQPKRSPIIKLKKTKKVDIVQLTNKMYKNAPCSKKECVQLQRRKQEKNKEQVQGCKCSQPSRKNIRRQFQDQPRDSYELYQRLYNQAKILQIQKKQLADLYQRQKINARNSKKASRSSKYLENYVPFYERLEWEVRKSQDKYKIYDKCPQLIQGTTKKYFTPTLISTKYHDVESRYSKDLSHQDILSYRHQLASSLNTSLMSIMSLDKSNEIVTNVEEFFFYKMKCLFIDQGEKYVSIKPSQIQLLSQVEFSIMQGFIRQIEENKVDAQQFESRLRVFYNSLGFSERQELRTHLRKSKNTPKKKSLGNKMTQSCIKVNQDRKRNHHPNSYYRKMQTFV